MGNGEGNFQVTMAMFTDSEFTDSVTNGAEVAVGTPFFVRIHFNGPGNLEMVVVNCVATPTEDPLAALVEWYLVRNG